MYDRKRIKCCILLVLIVMVCIHIHLGYFCAEKACVISAEPGHPQGQAMPLPLRLVDPHNDRNIPRDITLPENYHKTVTCSDNTGHYDDIASKVMYQNLTISDLEDDYHFDIDGESDILVFLHIQKTGGTTFGRHLVHNLEMSRPCICRHGKNKCDCKNSKDIVWLVSRYSTGWRCGLHADWTELTSCVDRMLDKIEGRQRNKRYLYITMLRDPFKRYMSEYKHVSRGATWKATRLQCNGRQASLEEVPFCFEGDDWAGVSLDEFMDCPHNLANNRQTRMLTNLSLSGCYTHGVMAHEHRQCIILQSAKDNLRKMAFFGLTEYQHETQYMFERTFGLNFIEDFFQYNHTHATEGGLATEQIQKIYKLNNLDTELYKYAKELFFRRLRRFQEKDATFRNSYRDYSRHSDNRELGDNRELDDNREIADDYEEGDENFTDDDDVYNHRIAARNKKYKKDSLHVYNRKVHVYFKGKDKRKGYLKSH